jgi:hypothetical protein
VGVVFVAKYPGGRSPSAHEGERTTILGHWPPPCAVQVDNEDELLAILRVKLGPLPPTTALLHHLRTARGKIHWAGVSCTKANCVCGGQACTVRPNMCYAIL